MSKKFFSMTALLLLLAMTLTGCGGGTPQNTTHDAAAIALASGITIPEILTDLGVDDQELLQKFDFTVGEALNNSSNVVGNIMVCDLLLVLDEINGQQVFKGELSDLLEGCTIDTFPQMIPEVLAWFGDNEAIKEWISVTPEGKIVIEGDTLVSDVLHYLEFIDEIQALFDGIRVSDITDDPMKIFGHVEFIELLTLLGVVDFENSRIYEVFGDVTLQEMVNAPSADMKNFLLCDVMAALHIENEQLLTLVKGITMGDIIEKGLGAFDHIKVKDVLTLLEVENAPLIKLFADSTLGNWRNDYKAAIKNLLLCDILVLVGVENQDILDRAGQVRLGEMIVDPIQTLAQLAQPWEPDKKWVALKQAQA